MKFENEVPELEYCKNLKELGYPQEGLFWWIKGKKFAFENKEIDRKNFVYDFDRYVDWGGVVLDNICIAPTVTEMGRLLPCEIKIPSSTARYFLTYHKSGLKYFDEYNKKHFHLIYEIKYVYNGHVANYENEYMSFGEIKESNARAKMLIYCYEKGIIK